jgi:hypothetical protein
LALQKTHGNQYVQRVVSGIQAKLKVGQPGDVYEREADRVADAVMRMPEPLEVSREDPQIQRVCQGFEEEELRRQPIEEEEEEELIQPKRELNSDISIRRQPEEEQEEEVLQTKEISGHDLEVTPDLESRIKVIRGGGQTLAESTREFFEPRFGADFSNVRVHEGGHAGGLAEALHGHVVFCWQINYHAGSQGSTHRVSDHLAQGRRYRRYPRAWLRQHGWRTRAELDAVV